MAILGDGAGTRSDCDSDSDPAATTFGTRITTTAGSRLGATENYDDDVEIDGMMFKAAPAYQAPDLYKPDLRTPGIGSSGVVQEVRGVSKYRGVQVYGSRWAAVLYEGHSRRHRCGVFDDPADAARAYDEKALEIGRSTEYLNFDDDVSVASAKARIAVKAAAAAAGTGKARPATSVHTSMLTHAAHGNVVYERPSGRGWVTVKVEASGELVTVRRSTLVGDLDNIIQSATASKLRVEMKTQTKTAHAHAADAMRRDGVDECEQEVGCILDTRVVGCVRQWRVSWVPLNGETFEPTWENKACFVGADGTVTAQFLAFEASRANGSGGSAGGGGTATPTTHTSAKKAVSGSAAESKNTYEYGDVVVVACSNVVVPPPPTQEQYFDEQRRHT